MPRLVSLRRQACSPCHMGVPQPRSQGLFPEARKNAVGTRLGVLGPRGLKFC